MFIEQTIDLQLQITEIALFYVSYEHGIIYESAQVTVNLINYHCRSKDSNNNNYEVAHDVIMK